jgi:hypothetical protein
MKLALFFSNSPLAGWSMGPGLVNTLRREGHAVIAVPTPTEQEAPPKVIEAVKARMPVPEVLKGQDAIIVSGPEHIGPWIDACYGKYEWKNLGVPRAAWLHESCNREDYNIDFDAIKWLADEWFFPAIQDAEFHDQEMFAAGRSHYLPFGVDTEIFKPHPLVNENIAHQNWDVPKTFDVGFLGLMYEKRAFFLRSLARHNIPPIRTGMCAIQDIRGYDHEGSMRLLAENTRQIKVFLNLPSLSRLLVSKITETLAVGTFLMTPALPEQAVANMALFTHNEHLIYYSPSNLGLLAQWLREWVSPDRDAERQRISENGCRLVHEKHSLKVRLAELLAKMAVKEAVQ